MQLKNSNLDDTKAERARDLDGAVGQKMMNMLTDPVIRAKLLGYEPAWDYGTLGVSAHPDLPVLQCHESLSHFSFDRFLGRAIEGSLVLGFAYDYQVLAWYPSPSFVVEYESQDGDHIVTGKVISFA